MKIGVTGSSKGATPAQKATLRELLDVTFSELHHCDCVGVDALASGIVKDNDSRAKIIIHPPEENSRSAKCWGDESWEPKPYLERNKDIAKVVDLLIAVPRTTTEQVRSGTWATVRYARANHKLILIIWPNGSVQVG